MKQFVIDETHKAQRVSVMDAAAAEETIKWIEEINRRMIDSSKNVGLVALDQDRVASDLELTTALPSLCRLIVLRSSVGDPFSA